MTEQMSLARQVDIVFKQLREELSRLSSGTVFIQIRNNVIGKFGLRHDPIQAREGTWQDSERGLDEDQFSSLKKMAIHSLRLKNNWTHGEIQFEFAVRKDTLISSIQLESNYNMAALLPSMLMKQRPANSYLLHEN